MTSRTMAAGLLAAGMLAGAAAPVAAVEQGDWMVRGRIIAVAPNDDSSVVNVGGAPLAGSDVSVDTGYTQIGRAHV